MDQRGGHLLETRTQRVTGQVLTVDAATGQECEADHVWGLIPADPQSVLLFSR